MGWGSTPWGADPHPITEPKPPRVNIPWGAENEKSNWNATAAYNKLESGGNGGGRGSINVGGDAPADRPSSLNLDDKEVQDFLHHTIEDKVRSSIQETLVKNVIRQSQTTESGTTMSDIRFL